MITFSLFGGSLIVGILICMALTIMNKYPSPSTKDELIVFALFGLAIVVTMLTFRDVTFADDECKRIEVDNVQYIEEYCEGVE